MHEPSFFIFLHKPIGCTSQDCLTQFKKKFGFKKVGHHGTLDPFADGLLLVGVGEATKFFNFIDDSQKTYQATLCLGIQTDTLDNTGKVVAQKEVPNLSLSDIQNAVQPLLGKIKQTPPMYSAIKQNGVALYKLARQGAEVERAARDVMIHTLQILDWQSPYLKIKTTVSRGTYIRVLAEQIAELLGTCAHLTQLSRTQLCGFDLSEAMSLDAAAIPPDKMITIPQMIGRGGQYREIHLNEQQTKDVMVGRRISSEREGNSRNAKLLAFHGNDFLGVLEEVEGYLKSVRLMKQTGC